MLLLSRSGTLLGGGCSAQLCILARPGLLQRSVSWKVRAAAPAAGRSAPRSTGGEQRRDGGGGRPWQQRGPERGGRGGGKGGGRGGRGWGDGGSRRRDEQPQQRQRQQQSRPWAAESAAGRDGAEDDWGGNSSGYDGDDGDGDFLYPARPSKASFREQLFGEALYGVAPILAALKQGVRTPHALLMQEGLSPAQRKDARALAEIQALVAAAGAAVRSVSKHELNMLAGNRPHQGLVLDVSPLEWHTLEVLPPPEELQQQLEGGAAGSTRHPVWLALDEVVDPQNLGAMLRSAYCLGVSGVLACSRNCSPLTPVVSKASAGAAELMTLHSCRSMPRTLADAAEKGWAVVGAAADADTVPLAQFAVERPTLLVMGNEGYGLRATVKRCCTQLVRIEMAAAGAPAGGRQAALVDSLNVSVAAGILLHHLVAGGSSSSDGGEGGGGGAPADSS